MNNINEEYKDVYAIYEIRNLVNNKVYYGSSKKVYQRCRGHYDALSKNKHPNKHLQSAINKYGLDNFDISLVEIIHTNDLVELRNRETFYIQSNKTYLDINGYNICSVGRGTSTLDFTDERKQNISKALKGKIPYNKGVKASKEICDKLKRCKRDKSKHSILVYYFDGTFIERLPSIADVTDKYGISKDNIISSCKGHGLLRQQYIFQYENFQYDEIDRKKNPTYGNNYFILTNIETQEEFKAKFAKDILHKVFNTKEDIRCKPLEKAIRESRIYDKPQQYKNYIIEFKIAHCDRNITDAPRQPIHKE